MTCRLGSTPPGCSEPALMRQLLTSWPLSMPHIARGDLETSSQDLAQLLGRPATPLTDVVGAAHDVVPNAARDSREH